MGASVSSAKRTAVVRGAVAVEFGLAVPSLLLIMLGGFHFIQVMVNRHIQADATAYAARAVATTLRPNGQPAVNAEAIIRARMGPTVNECGVFQVNVDPDVMTLYPANPAFGTRHGRAVEVTSRCTLPGRFSFTGTELNVKSTFPY
jgi:Flp pilus assembly protein TadG